MNRIIQLPPDSLAPRVEILPDVWLDARRAVWLSRPRLLVVADLHWGYAASHRAEGNLLPIWGDDEIAARLRALLADYRPAGMLWLGDSLHTLAGRAAAEAFLQAKEVETIVLSGNHDRRWKHATAATAERDGFFIMDGPPGVGREFNGAGFNATLRDYARIGLMMLDNGRANGHQIVSPEWVAMTTKPTEPVPNGENGYGMQWWTFDNGAYSAIGLQGQYIYVDPKTRTVVVKLSYFPPAEKSASDETAAFLKAVSAWNPD